MEEMTGQWLDRRTGKTIYIRDVIQDGDELIIMSSEGQVPTNIFQQYFVKMSEEDLGTTGVLPEVSGDQMNNVINQGLDASERIETVKPNAQPKISLDTPIGNAATFTPQPIQQASTSTSTVAVEEKSMNYSLIEKVMKKHKNAVTVKFSINKNDWPVNELQMLTETFDVPVDEICDYIISNYVNKDKMVPPLKKCITTALVIDK